jgi:3-dehydroquinate synthase
MMIFAAFHQEIRVDFRYGVYFTRDVFALNNPLLSEIVVEDGGDLPRKILVVVDRGLYRHHPHLLEKITDYLGNYPDRVQLACPPLLVPGGERVKNEATPVPLVHRAIHQANLCRHSYVLAVGGGAVIDMTGYAAATAHRGLRLIRIPTTVMAQADASIGVKNGINAFGKKNFLGTFAPPRAVLNGTEEPGHGGHAAGHPAERRPAFGAYRHRRRSLRVRFLTPPGFWPLGRPQAGAVKLV